MAQPNNPPAPTAAAPSAPSSSSSTTSQPQEPTPSPPPFHGTPPVQHNIALIAAVVGPIGLLLPGRGRGSLTLQNAILGAGSFFGLNQLAHDYTGRSVLQRSSDRWAALLRPFDSPLPDKALATRQLMEAERARRAAALPTEGGERAAAEAEMRRRQEAQEAARRGFFERVWMGGEGAGWKERRRDEDKKAMDSGKGVGDIIMDQIWEVWNQGKGKNGDADEKTDAGQAGTRPDGSAESERKP
ncbi:hypothetical protein QBC33DRAFT_616765 [Phialemonium atrogriseum]|uniref:Rhomboid family membrane protein n=1 Tax=Phialemonium atrogriseum TaxID=1093897 RepID=A0AAJ0C5H3_9PEZI|nr:uncharacterized protein QBC33DRAFT_616765 [Phialemonium atrogriseum]KAK1770326.1 hypothetical protein QBC33DRAFT_616765 [Phialemonium atrogriseum]